MRWLAITKNHNITAYTANTLTFILLLYLHRLNVRERLRKNKSATVQIIELHIKREPNTR